MHQRRRESAIRFHCAQGRRLPATSTPCASAAVPRADLPRRVASPAHPTKTRRRRQRVSVRPGKMPRRVRPAKVRFHRCREPAMNFWPDAGSRPGTRTGDFPPDSAMQVAGKADWAAQCPRNRESAHDRLRRRASGYCESGHREARQRQRHAHRTGQNVPPMNAANDEPDRRGPVPAGLCRPEISVGQS